MNKPAKRNIVEGLNDIGSVIRSIPRVAEYIHAVYVPGTFEEAYHVFTNTPEPEDLPEDHDGYGVSWTNWVLRGPFLSFVICIESGERSWGWQIRCPDEETYLAVKKVMQEILP